MNSKVGAVAHDLRLRQCLQPKPGFKLESKEFSNFEVKDEPRSDPPVTDKVDGILKKVEQEQHVSPYDLTEELEIEQNVVLIQMKKAGYTKKLDTGVLIGQGVTFISLSRRYDYIQRWLDGQHAVTAVEPCRGQLGCNTKMSRLDSQTDTVSARSKLKIEPVEVAIVKRQFILRARGRSRRQKLATDTIKEVEVPTKIKIVVFHNSRTDAGPRLTSSYS
ncbi:hypothetical protein EVAR_88079_1 [Eumeta japonica]|uniref:Uncharacterized protein n=1 Tax=Eumeta variegata TaxID=151549 RepID=A0A4C1WJD7_EUMVA|nr:hypothetical protein EVAR_88079_1 [Eumeta japonica]